MMKNLILLSVIFVFATSFGQSNESIKELEKYGVTSGVLTMTFNEDWKNLAFERHTVSTSVGSDFVFNQVASFDDSKPVGEKWKLTLENDKTPEKSSIKYFNKDMNPKKKTILEIDPATLKKVNDDASGIIYTFKYIEKSIPGNYAYLKDCTSKATINKSSGKLEKLEIANDGPTKLGSLKISSVNFAIDYKFDSALGQYVITRYELNNSGKFMGASATNKTVREYSKFSKVN